MKKIITSATILSVFVQSLAFAGSFETEDRILRSLPKSPSNRAPEISLEKLARVYEQQDKVLAVLEQKLAEAKSDKGNTLVEISEEVFQWAIMSGVAMYAADSMTRNSSTKGKSIGTKVLMVVMFGLVLDMVNDASAFTYTLKIRNEDIETLKEAIALRKAEVRNLRLLVSEQNH